MALNSGFPRIEASNNTFSDWLNRTNEITDLVRGDDIINGSAIVTANSSGSDTFGNVRINGEFVANTLIAFDELRGGDLFSGNSANLSITTNAVFTSTANLVTIEKYLQVDTDSLFVGNVEAQSTIQFTGNDSILEFAGANQTFIWDASNTHATIRTDSAGSLELNADVAANGTNDSRIDLKVDSVNVASFVEGGNVVFYSADGVNQKVIWDATNERLGVNATPATGVALTVSGNTHTTDLNVTQQTTSGNVVVNDELRGSNTLTVTTNALFTAAEVTINNDLFVQGDAQISSNLTVNTDSTFVGNIEVQTDSLFAGNVEAQSTIEFTKGSSTLQFAGANQIFIWDATNTQSSIRTNANGSLIIDADKTDDGASTSRIDLRVDDTNSVRIEDNHVAFYNQAGTAKRLYWDATNLVLGVNTASPQTDVALDVVGNTHTTSLNVAQQTTSGSVVVNNELRGNTTLTITTNTEFTSAVDQVLIRNDLFVNGDVQVSSNLTVNTDSLFMGDSLFVGNVEAQSSIQVIGSDSTLEFAGANQTFIWDATESTIRTNADGSLIIDADKTANGVSTSRIDLRVDDTNSIRVEGDHVAFYNQAGTVKGLYWDATDLVLGINTATPNTSIELDVDGTTQTTNLVVTDEVTANVVTVENNIKGSTNLTVSSNVVFQANATAQANLSVDGKLTVGAANLNYLLVPANYNNLIPNQTSGRLLGNTSNRWEGYITDLDVSANVEVGGNVTVTDTITTDSLVVTNSAALPSALSFTGVTDFEDITVTGTASFANLEVGSIVTNTAAIVGTNSTVSSTSPTKIDEFDKTISKGFKYIIHGENALANSAFGIEINCSHNGTDVFFTRFGEVSNNFDAVLVPQINGGNVELIATCSGASGGNTHTFNLVRIETR